MRHPRAFTLVEAVALFVVLVIVIAIAFAVIPQRRRTTGHPQHNTQLRGIHQAMVMFAQGNGGYFPGFDADGQDLGITVEQRLQVLLENNYFTGEYLVSPSDVKTAWTTGTLSTAQYSYALLQLPPAGHRRAEWAETLNTEAPVVSDRAISAHDKVHSVHTAPGDGWRGGVAYNDNHVVFESTHVLPTKYGPSRTQEAYPATADTLRTFTVTAADDLFIPAGKNDAYLIHSGNE